MSNPHKPKSQTSIAVDIIATAGEFKLQAKFNAAAQSCTAIVGPNGSGKTSLLHAIAGLLPIQQGTVTLNNQLVDDPANAIYIPPERRPIALHSQHNLLFEHLSVIDNIAFGPRSSGISKTQANQIAWQWLERVGLSDLGAATPAQLSGGQAQRVGLARAAACNPAVLLLDESLAALDSKTRSSIRHLIADIAATKVLVTHDLIEARILADQLLVMENGQITQSGTPQEVAATPRTAWIADLLELNLFAGHASGTTVTLDCGITLITATATSGPVLVSFSPAAITLSAEKPQTSARNTWPTQVTHTQIESDRVKVFLAPPAVCWAWVTPQAAKELRLSAGTHCWAALKATELTVQQA